MDKLELARARMNEMGFDELDQDQYLFYDWPNFFEHLDWLLQATREEIKSWLDSLRPHRRGINRKGYYTRRAQLNLIAKTNGYQTWTKLETSIIQGSVTMQLNDREAGAGAKG